MSWLRSLVRLPHRLASHREQGRALAGFRVGIGLTVLSTLLPAWTSGAWKIVWLDLAHGGHREMNETQWLVALIGGSDEVTIPLLMGVGCLASLCLVFGLFSRVAAFVALQVCLALFSLATGTGGGHDRLITNALWILVLADSDRTWSLMSLLRNRSVVDATPVACWPRYLGALQLVVMYVATGLQKISSEWHFAGGFSAVYYALQAPEWRRYDNSWAGFVFPLTQAGTIGAWLYESGAFVWLLLMVAHHPGAGEGWRGWKRWARRLRLRWGMLALGVTLHISLQVLMNLGPFQAVTLSYYFCLFHGGVVEGDKA